MVSKSFDLENQVILETQSFDYASLNGEARIVVRQRTGEIKNLIRRNAQDIVDIGQKLAEVKEQLGHGHFRNWLKAEFDWSVSAAAKFMQVSEQFKCVKFTHLEIAASALYLLASPSTPEEVRQEALERASQGENITHAEAKVICSHSSVTKNLKPDKRITVDVPASTVERESLQDGTGMSTDADLEPTRYATAAPIAKEVTENSTASGNRDKQELSVKEGELAQHIDLSGGVRPVEIVEVEATANPKQGDDDDENQTEEEQMEKALDKLTEVVEVDATFSSGEHQKLPAVRPQAQAGLVSNYSALATVSDPPQPKNDGKISEFRKVLARKQFSCEALEELAEDLVYLLGVKSLGILVFKSTNQDETVELCHECFDLMNQETFSRLNVNRMKLSGLTDSAIEYLNAETGRLLSERNIKKV